MNDLREALAEYAHDAWSGWWRYHLAKCEHWPDGSLVVPAGYAAAILALAGTPYANLPEHQKDNDRAEADKITDIFDRAVFSKFEP